MLFKTWQLNDRNLQQQQQQQQKNLSPNKPIKIYLTTIYHCLNV